MNRTPATGDTSFASWWLSLLTGEVAFDPDLGGYPVGENVSVRYRQEQARYQFAAALHRLVPESTTSLLAEALALHQRHNTTVQNWIALAGLSTETAADPLALRAALTDLHSGPPELAARSDELMETMTTLDAQMTAHIAKWQRRFHLEDSWIAPRALRTIWEASALCSNGEPYGGPIMLSEPFAPEISGGEVSARPVWIDESIGFFDPNTESVAEAHKRLRSVLSKHLRTALEQIADADRTGGEKVSPARHRTDRRFEWVVRYQVGGESRKAIAKNDGVDYAQVTRSVNETADSIGLTLRQAKGGRPPKPRANTKRMR